VNVRDLESREAETEAEAGGEEDEYGGFLFCKCACMHARVYSRESVLILAAVCVCVRACVRACVRRANAESSHSARAGAVERSCRSS